MLQFITSNWLTLLSLVFGVFVSWFFHRLQKGVVVTAKEERNKHAREELQDVVETYIINKQEINETTIRNHIDAIERKHQVVLSPFYTPTAVLQDVALRLQNSSHLDKDQKTEYALQIVSIISGVVDNQREITPTASALLDLAQTIETAIEDGKNEIAVKLIKDLKAQLLKARIIQIRNGDAPTGYLQLTGALLAGIVTVVFTLFVLFDFGIENEIFLQIIASVLFGYMAYNVVILARRIAKRSQNSEKKN